jgi:hypothetical protein
MNPRDFTNIGPERAHLGPTTAALFTRSRSQARLT